MIGEPLKEEDQIDMFEFAARHLKDDRKFILVMVTLLAFVAITIGIQIQLTNDHTNYCDERYGVDNWADYVNGTTGWFHNILVYDCFPKGRGPSR